MYSPMHCTVIDFVISHNSKFGLFECTAVMHTLLTVHTAML